MTEPAYLAAVRESYDSVADVYVERVITPAELDPLSRAMLTAFAELVRDAGRGPVADLGCGPGRVTAHLSLLGLSAFGVDLSPRMVVLAREAHPELRFTEGSMTALDIADNELGGILAYYSTHHTPPERLPSVFAEFHRTLAPGGHLMWGDYTGAYEHMCPTQAYDRPVSYESYFLPLDRTAELLRGAGFNVTARMEQEPDGRVKRRHACLLARKPEA
ncbi:class I SAM-dependent methyltransferase [Streptomyces sp. WM6378]|uniref:class I SAM-dependent methyltransferase n=1 Tax=Streptomyces sp. WM6378 TaxID=1415557 RepID=UPI0006AE838A|nr:class I SAM-dependent methyltransferase [Streptomyces sp. WM6378]KOU42879.1 methyltransferase [Streptomyces sp. WM6378]